MKKSFLFLFYLCALVATSYFLWQYLQAPKPLIISLIISLCIIWICVRQKSRYTSFVGVTLLSIHMIWFLGFSIPTYDKEPDIRQWYRRSPNMLFSLSTNTWTLITLTHGNNIYTTRADTLLSGRPIYQYDTITTAGPTISSDDRVMIGFRDSSNAQIFPQSNLTIEKLSPDFSGLTMSRIGIVLSGWIVSVSTRRTHVTISEWYVKAWNMTFFCSSCIIAYSGTNGMIASRSGFSGQQNSWEIVHFSGWSYIFWGKNISASNSSSLTNLVGSTENTTLNRNNTYDIQKDKFIVEHRWRPFETSSLLANLSKLKMALVGLFDRTARDQYNYLLLFNHLRDRTNPLPNAFIDQKEIDEFIQ